MKKRIQSFRYAINGFMLVLKSEMNMKIHFTAAVLALIAGLILKVNFTEWAVLLISIAMVFASEIGNTVVEKYLDAYHPERSEIVGALKDMAAAAVLVISVFSALIGCFIFIPKILEMI